MNYREMTEADLPMAAELYLFYYNTCEGGQWSAETTRRRILQILRRPDSYSLVCEMSGEITAIALGYFEQYDDGFAYDLVEIVVAAARQNQGIGTALMREVETRVKEKGAMLIQLQAVNDCRHANFYGRLGFCDVKNLTLKTKML